MIEAFEASNAVDYLVTHPKEAEKMNRNSQNAVQEEYNWRIEEQKLLAFYKGPIV